MNFLIFAGLFLILELFVRFYGYFVNLPTDEFALVNFAERNAYNNPYYPVNLYQPALIRTHEPILDVQWT